MNCGFHIILLLISIIQSLSAQDASEIVRRADEIAKGKTSISTLTIQTIHPKWTRQMTVKSWTKGNDYAIILVTAPAKEKGMVFIKRKT